LDMKSASFFLWFFKLFVPIPLTKVIKIWWWSLFKNDT